MKTSSAFNFAKIGQPAQFSGDRPDRTSAPLTGSLNSSFHDEVTNLWRDSFDTTEIASILMMPEYQIVRLINAYLDRKYDERRGRD